MISRESIQIAYSFFHQKERVFRFSSLSWQRDDIELAIADYVNRMSPELYAHLADGRPAFLLEHTSFADDLSEAVSRLEHML